MNGELRLEDPEIVKLDLSEEEMNVLLSRFITNPSAVESMDKTLTFMDEIFRISTPITKGDAIKLQSRSDR